MRLLLEAGAKVDPVIGRTKRLLHWASTEGHTDILELLQAAAKRKRDWEQEGGSDHLCRRCQGVLVVS